MSSNSQEQEIQHYFFRYGSGNYIFKENYSITSDLQIKNNNKTVEEVYLGIYYTDFTVSDYTNKKLTTDKNAPPSTLKLTPQEYSTVERFFETKEGSIYWLFVDQHIIALKAFGDFFDMEDIPEGENFRDVHSKFKTKPKLRKFKVLKVFERFLLPELFSTTDSSNTRGTLLNLDTDQKKCNLDIAKALVTSKGTIKINEKIDILNYLSPIQLETFFFKLFDSNGFVVGSVRGGSRSLIDLHIHTNDSLDPLGFKFGEQGLLLQIKRSITSNEANHFLKENPKMIYIITLTKNIKVDKDNEEYVYDHSKIKTLLDNPKAKATLNWAVKILGQKYFSFDASMLKDIQS